MVFASSGAPPFGTGNWAALANRIMHGEPELGELAGQLRALVKRCLAKESAHRPTVMQLFQALVGHGDLDEVPLARKGTTTWEPAAPQAARVLPFYFVCDESVSMRGEPLEAINSGLEALRGELVRTREAAARTRLGIIGFSADAEIRLPLSDLSSLHVLPKLRARGGTRYGPAFDLLRETIEQDIFLIKANGGTVYRPMVFFLSDGRPNDEQWRTAYRQLASPAFESRPNFIAFGLGDCNLETIKHIATYGAFQADGSMSVASALKEVASSLATSIMNSREQLVVPQQVPGFTSVPLDEI